MQHLVIKEIRKSFFLKKQKQKQKKNISINFLKVKKYMTFRRFGTSLSSKKKYSMNVIWIQEKMFNKKKSKISKLI